MSAPTQPPPPPVEPPVEPPPPSSDGRTSTRRADRADRLQPAAPHSRSGAHGHRERPAVGPRHPARLRRLLHQWNGAVRDADLCDCVRGHRPGGRPRCGRPALRPGRPGHPADHRRFPRRGPGLRRDRREGRRRALPGGGRARPADPGGSQPLPDHLPIRRGRRARRPAGRRELLGRGRRRCWGADPGVGGRERQLDRRVDERRRLTGRGRLGVGRGEGRLGLRSRPRPADRRHPRAGRCLAPAGHRCRRAGPLRRPLRTHRRHLRPLPGAARRAAGPAGGPLAVAGQVAPAHPALHRAALPLAGVLGPDVHRRVRHSVHRPVPAVPLRLQSRRPPLELAGELLRLRGERHRPLPAVHARAGARLPGNARHRVSRAAVPGPGAREVVAARHSPLRDRRHPGRRHDHLEHGQRGRHRRHGRADQLAGAGGRGLVALHRPVPAQPVRPAPGPQPLGLPGDRLRRAR